MMLRESSIVADGNLPSGDEAGTGPGDRQFRPDVEGLRAVAVLLVVLYHAGVPGLTGGYVGVDVFFVISGFVITGLLLRERSATGRTSILDFYARRVRRILPAAGIVILGSAFFSYLVLGPLLGSNVADDGRWAAVFLANFHFASVGTNYLAAQLPPSPLQNFWSLSVEEQFYIIYPTLFLLVASAKYRLSLRGRLVVALVIVIVASYVFSVVETSSHPAASYFSPFTRAWELALGALIAVCASWLKKIPSRMAATLTWVGLGTILYSAFSFNAHTVYPGSLVAVPVVGAALIIAGGVAIPRAGAELLLGLRPFRWLGKLSYSLYLWHWPILMIAADYLGKPTLGLWYNLPLLLLALSISMVTYQMVETPFRHWRLAPRPSVMAGIALVLTTAIVLSLLISLGGAAPTAVNGFIGTAGVVSGGALPAANAQVVLSEVAAAVDTTTVPTSVSRANYGASYVEWGSYEKQECQANFFESSETICNLGDLTGTHLMVVYGDSRALMWILPFEAIAKAQHWRLVILGKYGCPAAPVTIAGWTKYGEAPGPDIRCDEWHTWATNWIDEHRPNLLVFSQEDFYSPTLEGGKPFTASQWKHGLDDLFSSFKAPNMRMVLLGTTPTLAEAGPLCLAEHPQDVQACSQPVRLAVPSLSQVDRKTALADHVEYINTIPWFCSRICTPVIGNYEIYDSTDVHISSPWAWYLQRVLGRALGFR
jgi:peptidoglycan/LPS O-acetylase OafA/YrhL